MQVSISGPRRHTAVARATLALCALLGTTGVLAQNADGSDPTSPALSEVQVRETSGSSGYQGAQRNTAATRTDTPLLETPQAVRVVPQQLIEDLGARRLADMVNNAAVVVGVEAMAAAQGMEFDRSLKSSPLIEAQFAAIRQRVAFLEQDRYLAPDIDAMREWALQADWPAPLRACQPSHA